MKKIVYITMFLITMSVVFALDDDIGVLLRQVPKSDGIYQINYSLYDAASGGTRQFNQIINSVNITLNTGSIIVENISTVDFSVPLWQHIIINGTTLDRKKLLIVPGSYKANSTEKWDNLDVPTDLNNLLQLHWNNITNKPTNLDTDSTNDVTKGSANLTLVSCKNITGGSDGDFCTDTSSSFDLNITSDNGSGVITDSEIFTFTGGNNVNTTMSGNTITINSEVVDTDTNANTICTGTTTYLDGEGNCDTLDQLGDFINDVGFYSNIGNFTGAKTDTKICVWDNTASLINCTYTDVDTTYTENSKYLTLIAQTFGFDESELNTTIDMRDSDTVYDSDETYIYETGNVFYLNITYFDIYGRANTSDFWDGLDSPSSFATDSISESAIDFDVSCASGSHLYVNGNDLACELDDDTPDTDAEVPDDITIDVSGKNITIDDNDYICLGTSGCADSYLTFNGTTLIIKVN